jgi:NAD(P)-dependent dehydrogenase (short-subunit alcohol dehydrogenase family)
MVWTGRVASRHIKEDDVRLLEGKVALITGGAGAIGLATARRAAAEGATVAIADVSPDRIESALVTLRAAGASASGHVVDVTSETSVDGLVQAVLGEHGRIDVLFTSAGVLVSGTATDTSVEDWLRTIGVNLTGSFLCARAVLPSMVAGGGGAIVLMSSTSGLVAEPATAAYCASKGGVLMLGRQLAVDYTRLGVRVNVICPGWIDTPFNDPAIEASGGAAALEPFIDAMIPLGRQGRPDEVADIVVFLASDQSRLMTGSVVVADGGLTAQ